MTDLDHDPLVVSTPSRSPETSRCSSSPIPAGVLSDLVDRRIFLIDVLPGRRVPFVSHAFAVLVAMHVVTPTILPRLRDADRRHVGNSFMYPVWQSIVPMLVPRADLDSAIAANSGGSKTSAARLVRRLAGHSSGAFGIAVPFFVNARKQSRSYRRPPGGTGSLTFIPQRAAIPANISEGRSLPASATCGTVRRCKQRAAGPSHSTSSQALYWALLPLVARSQIGGGPETYGTLLSAIGIGAVGGAFVLPNIKGWMGANRAVALGTLGTAVALVLFGVATNLLVGSIAGLIAGVSWIVALASLNVSRATLPSGLGAGSWTGRLRHR